jgi:hypothetical protein
MKEHSYEDEMEAYLSSEMTGKEQASFEEIIKNSPALAQDIKVMNEIDDVLNHNVKEQAFAAQLEMLGNQYFLEEGTNSKSSNTFKKWIIGFFVIALVGVSLWWFNSARTPKTSEQLFASYYEPYPVSEATRGNDTEEAYISYYNSQEYDKASSFLEELITQFPEENKYQIALGNSYLNTNPSKIDDAIRVFTKITENENVYQSTAQWYLALAFLKNNEKENALFLLENLAQKAQGKYSELAQSLLDEM